MRLLICNWAGGSQISARFFRPTDQSGRNCFGFFFFFLNGEKNKISARRYLFRTRGPSISRTRVSRSSSLSAAKASQGQSSMTSEFPRRSLLGHGFSPFLRFLLFNLIFLPQLSSKLFWIARECPIGAKFCSYFFSRAIFSM